MVEEEEKKEKGENVIVVVVDMKRQKEISLHIQTLYSRHLNSNTYS